MTDESKGSAGDVDALWWFASIAIAFVLAAATWWAMNRWQDNIDTRNAHRAVFQRYPLVATQPIVTAAIVFVVVICVSRVYAFMLRVESRSN